MHSNLKFVFKNILPPNRCGAALQYCDITIVAINEQNNFILYILVVICAPMAMKIERLFLSVVDHKLSTYKTIALKNNNSPADL